MKILNFGSLNIDYTFRVKEIVRPGQTIDSYDVERYPGGKGLNQSVALARAGAKVYHAGMIGQDGLFLKNLLENEKVDCQFLKIVETGTGSAFIQVDMSGQNSIVINGGANRKNTCEYCDKVLKNFKAGDVLLLQNEINKIDYLIDRAYEIGMYIVLNPSPINEAIFECNLEKISLFLLNEDESRKISASMDDDMILEKMRLNYPKSELVMTLGSRGSVYQGRGRLIHQKAYRSEAVDTTAAGDTFTGYYLAEYMRKTTTEKCLDIASRAAAISVSRKGASSSIPHMQEVFGNK